MTKETIIENTCEVTIIPQLDVAAVESIYSSLSVKLQSITITPKFEESFWEKALSISSEIFTLFSGAFDFAGLLKSKSATKEIEELNKLCKNSKSSLGEYRKALETLDGALKAVGDSAFKAQGHTKNLNKKFKEVGKALGEGINAGVKDTFNSLEKTMVDLGKTMEDAFKDKEKIQSPSKVFKKYGEYITEGLVDGIKEGSDDVTDMMRDLGDDMESSFGEKALSFGGGFALAAGVLGTIVEMFSNLMSTNEEFGAAVDEVWTQITEAFAPVTDAVMNLITSLGEEGMGGSFSWFSDALNGISELAVSVK
ncbi:MAG: hypothetical protein IKM61_00085 [Eubacteriaceae bacterium]|nr:hypothetical protein [Eubacteriaceae bacterium]